MLFTYIARRKLLGAHTLNTAYSIASAQVRMEPSRSPVVNSHQAKDGTRETLQDRTDRLWEITTGKIHEDDLPAWEEFLASVEAFETFLFDPSGWVGLEVAPRSVEMTAGFYNPRRIESSKYFQFSFTLREV